MTVRAVRVFACLSWARLEHFVANKHATHLWAVLVYTVTCTLTNSQVYANIPETAFQPPFPPKS
jgi:hypothetical protein